MVRQFQNGPGCAEQAPLRFPQRKYGLQRAILVHGQEIERCLVVEERIDIAAVQLGIMKEPRTREARAQFPPLLLPLAPTVPASKHPEALSASLPPLMPPPPGPAPSRAPPPPP